MKVQDIYMFTYYDMNSKNYILDQHFVQRKFFLKDYNIVYIYNYMCFKYNAKN